MLLYLLILIRGILCIFLWLVHHHLCRCGDVLSTYSQGPPYSWRTLRRASILWCSILGGACILCPRTMPTASRWGGVWGSALSLQHTVTRLFPCTNSNCSPLWTTVPSLMIPMHVLGFSQTSFAVWLATRTMYNVLDVSTRVLAMVRLPSIGTPRGSITASVPPWRACNLTESCLVPLPPDYDIGNQQPHCQLTFGKSQLSKKKPKKSCRRRCA